MFPPTPKPEIQIRPTTVDRFLLNAPSTSSPAVAIVGVGSVAIALL
ncbi:hypothetical protein IQ236_24810 [Planktothrix mougeotii LEGE 06226]|uniref:Uncharacterized protein n=1 Tax=Planktothrix mougeotii LEGE 06226 TaxID=1828728 RepID=A0ABR9UIY9_9CYAN|nr:hypothetical protein [Planktothrix mougeotii LEGE 06226]